MCLNNVNSYSALKYILKFSTITVTDFVVSDRN